MHVVVRLVGAAGESATLVAGLDDAAQRDGDRPGAATDPFGAVGLVYDEPGGRYRS